jgi:hypothetical protein
METNAHMGHCNRGVYLMKDFAVANTTGSFPLVEFQDITAPGDGLGTPAIKDWVQTLVGWPQALMDYAGLTPDGNHETGAASQLLTAMKLMGMYPGVVLPLHINDDPANLIPAPRLMLLTGQTVLAADYPELVAATYIGDANNANAAYEGYFKTGDTPGTVRNTAGPYFVLPDLRGHALRGDDSAGTTDPDGASRVLPDSQAHAVDNHGHAGIGGINTGGGTPTLFGVANASLPTGFGAVSASSGSYASVATTGSGSGPIFAWSSPADIYNYSSASSYGQTDAEETRMINTNCRWAVIY